MPLHAQQIHEPLDARHVALTRGNHITGDRFLASGFHGVARFDVEVLQDHLREMRRVLQRRDHAGLAVVRVVAQRPVEVARRGPRPEPLALALIAASGGDRRCVRRRLPRTGRRRTASAAAGGRIRVAEVHLRRVRAARPLNLVHPDHAVVIRRHEREVAWRPHVHVAVRPDARHPVLRHLRHLEVRHHRQLAEENRIEIRVLRRLPAERVQQGLRLMEVVHDRRVPLQIPVEQRAHLDLRVVDVAVVVVEHVLAPVRHAGPGRMLFGFVDAVLVVPVDVAIASVRIGDRRDRHDHVVADVADDGRILCRDPVCQLHEHFRRPDFAAVQAARQVIERLRFRDDGFRLRIGETARIGQLPEVRAVLLEVLDRLVRPDEDDDEIPAFVALADGLDLHARRFGGERAVVGEDVCVVRQLVRLADVMAEDVLRARNAGHLGQMIH